MKDGKRVIVVGAASGLGADLVQRFVGHGAEVTAVDGDATSSASPVRTVPAGVLPRRYPAQVSIRSPGEQESEPSTRQRRGRPRDTAVDARILEVARAVYAARGWAGFNFDVVAHRAKVSKDAIYRRYSSRIHLLLSTMTHTADAYPEIVFDGDIRDYLVAVAQEYFQRYTGEHGLGSLRIFIEGQHNAELFDAYHRERSAPVVLHARAAVRTAMDAGRLPQAKTPTAVLDAILGGVVMHVLATPPDLRDKMILESEAYLVDLVDLVLRGCGYRTESA